MNVMKKAANFAALLNGIYMPLVMLVGNVCVAFIIMTGGHDAIRGSVTVGMLSTFISYATGFFEPIISMSGIFANLQSAQARGDAEHDLGDELTLDIFSAAVREFVGLCARMPYMARSFAAMGTKERDGYESLLQTMEGWCAGSRRALDSYSAEGGILIE